MKRIFLDTETTGLDPNRHWIHEMSFVMEDPFKDLLVERTYKIRIPADRDLSVEALKISGKTPKDLYTYPHVQGVIPKIVFDFKKLVNIYDPYDRMLMYGMNPKFDKDMMYGLLAYCKEKNYEGVTDVHWGSFLQKSVIEVQSLVLNKFTAKDFQDFKSKKLKMTLGNLANYLGLVGEDEVLHGSLTDAHLCRRLWYWTKGKELTTFSHIEKVEEKEVNAYENNI